MGKLTASLTGEEYTDEQKDEMWTDIHMRAKCPECGAIDSMLKGPCGGMTINIKCQECGTVFWSSPFPGFGAYPLSQDYVVTSNQM